MECGKSLDWKTGTVEYGVMKKKMQPVCGKLVAAACGMCVIT